MPEISRRVQPLPLAERVNSIVASPIRAIAALLAKAMKSKNIISFGILFISGETNSIDYLFFGFISSVIVMNMVSNSYMSRVELAQLFWLFAGLFYAQKQLIEQQGSLDLPGDNAKNFFKR